MPGSVVRRAASLLAALEAEGGPLRAGAPLGALPLFAAAGPDAAPPPAPPPPDRPDPPALAALAAIDPDLLSPREALEALYRLKSMLPVCTGGDKL